MICYDLAMGKQHLGTHVVVGYSIKIFWPGLFITSPEHLGQIGSMLSPLSHLCSPNGTLFLVTVCLIYDILYCQSDHNCPWQKSFLHFIKYSPYFGENE